MRFLEAMDRFPRPKQWPVREAGKAALSAS